MIILGEPSFSNQSLQVIFSFLKSLFCYLGSMKLSEITSDAINNVALKIIQQFRASKDEIIQTYVKKYDTILKTFNLVKEQVTYFNHFTWYQIIHSNVIKQYNLEEISDE